MTIPPRRSIFWAFVAAAATATGVFAEEPAIYTAPSLPQIPNQTFQITDFGGVGDGKTMNTDAFKKAIAAIEKAGGGRLVVPKGDFLTLPLNLISHLDIHLEEGATIQFPADLAPYASMEPLVHAPESLAKMDGGNSSLFYGEHLTDIAFTGSGTIDGGGAPWWKAQLKINPKKKAATAPAGATEPATTQEEDTNNFVPADHATLITGHIKGRPKMVILTNCQRIHLDGLSLVNSPMWFFVPVQCTDVTIENVKVNAPAKSPNTDALDPTASTNVLIRNCDLNEGDDNVAVKAIGGPSSNIRIENVRL